jgi:hypothetical protein
LFFASLTAVAHPVVRDNVENYTNQIEKQKLMRTNIEIK